MGETPEERRIRSFLESASRKIVGGSVEERKEKLALCYASMRVSDEVLKQKSFSTIKRFELPVNATAGRYLAFQKERLMHYENLRSFDIEGVAFVTPPPLDKATYHIIDTTRPSEEDPRKSISIMQTLVRQDDSYVVGLRATPKDPNDPDGFFLFSDPNIRDNLPPFLGKFFILKCDSSYRFPERIRVRAGILGTIVECVEGIAVHGFVSEELREVLETKMLVFGECLRMHVPLEYFIDNFDSDVDIQLPDGVLPFMRNWSYLSKAIFTFYLGLLGLLYGLPDAKDSFIRAQRSFSAAVRKFERKNVNLDLRAADGHFSLRKLAGNYLRLLKYDPVSVKMLIMRRELGYKGRFTHVKHSQEDIREELEEHTRVANEEAEERELRYAQSLVRANQLFAEYLDLEEDDNPWKGCYPDLAQGPAAAAAEA